MATAGSGGGAHAEELIDCFDANMNPIGVFDRRTAHRAGLWHRTIHIWLVHRKGGLLFQHRSATVGSYPGYLDVSAAGHILAGETPEQAFREIREELGIDVPPESLTQIGARTEASDLGDGQRNREHQLVYLAETALMPANCRPDPGEVQGVYLIPLDDLWALSQGESRSVKGIAVSSDGHRTGHQLPVSMGNLLPRVGHYYACVGIMAERMLQGSTQFAI